MCSERSFFPSEIFIGFVARRCILGFMKNIERQHMYSIISSRAFMLVAFILQFTTKKRLRLTSSNKWVNRYKLLILRDPCEHEVFFLFLLETCFARKNLGPCNDPIIILFFIIMIVFFFIYRRKRSRFTYFFFNGFVFKQYIKCERTAFLPFAGSTNVT